MPTIVDSLTSLISSIFSTFAAALQSVLAVIQAVLQAVFGVVQGVFSAVWGAISGLARTFEGLTKFLLGNIAVIGVVVVAFVVYSAYQQRTGKPAAVAPVKQKKTN